MSHGTLIFYNRRFVTEMSEERKGDTHKKMLSERKIVLRETKINLPEKW